MLIINILNVFGKNAKNLVFFLLKETHLGTMASSAPRTSSFFKEKSDIYRGVSVDSKDLQFSDSEFEGNLNSALVEWIKSGVRGIWFRVNLKDSSFIPILVKHGFFFHHAKTTYAMLTRWLPEDEPNLLPQFPHTHIGVGGMVINEKNEVLVIQERYQKRKHWKFPGGYSNPGEDFADTVQREVLEETGIEAEFVSVVSLRHHHQHIFQCSDIYVVCLLRPLTSAIVSSKEEIAQCQWMDLAKYRDHPDVTDFNKFIVDAYLESQRLKAAISPSPVLSFNKDSYNNVYTVQNINDSKR